MSSSTFTTNNNNNYNSTSSNHNTSFTTTLQNASQSWQQFALESKQRPLLSNTITQSKANNQQSLSTRKTLAETTKSFKKIVKQLESIFKNNTTGSSSSSNNNNNDKAIFDTFTNQCKTLVKSYQEEIDNLTKRCKSYDNIINDLHKEYTNPNLIDPTILIHNSMEYIMSLEGQVHHLLKGMEEIQNEMIRQSDMSKKDINDLEMELSNNRNEMNLVRKELEILRKDNQSLVDEMNSNNNANNTNNSGNSNSYLNKEEKEELINLRKEVAEYELEFKNLKNQDITIKKLNAKIEDLMMNQEEELQKELK